MKSEYKSVYTWLGGGRGEGIWVSDFIKTLQEPILESNEIQKFEKKSSNTELDDWRKFIECALYLEPWTPIISNRNLSLKMMEVRR